jgi:hypothetical protein
MLGLIGKLAPLLSGMTKNEDGTPKPVSGEFQWLVRLPLLLGVVLVLVGVFAPVDEDKKAELYEIGVALLVGGPVAYGARKQMKKGDALKAPAPVSAPPPPAPVIEAPKTDDEAARKIENL